MWNVKATLSATGYTSIDSKRMASQASNERLDEAPDRLAAHPRRRG